MRKKLKIAWALDAADLSHINRPAVSYFLESLRKRSDVEVQPIYLYRPSPLERSTDFSDVRVEEIIANYDDTIRQSLERAQIQDLLEPKVLVDLAPETNQPFEALTTYLEKGEFGLILLCSHARTGIARILLGSFAERFFEYSPVPMIILNPKMDHPVELERVLYPVDRMESSLEGFRRVLQLAEQLQLDVLLFHHQSKDARNGTFEPYLDLAKSFSVQVQTERNFDYGSSSQAIVEQAQKMNCQLIAMITGGSAFREDGKESVTRRVVRYSHEPVWVFHAEEKSS